MRTVPDKAPSLSVSLLFLSLPYWYQTLCYVCLPVFCLPHESGSLESGVNAGLYHGFVPAPGSAFVPARTSRVFVEGMKKQWNPTHSLQKPGLLFHHWHSLLWSFLFPLSWELHPISARRWVPTEKQQCLVLLCSPIISGILYVLNKSVVFKL